MRCRIAAPGRCLPLLALLLLLGCTPHRSTASGGVSDQGLRLCRERLADHSPGMTPARARQEFSACLRSIDRERASPPAVGETAAPAPLPIATPEQRYLYCRLHSDAIATAYDAYTRSSAAWAFADASYPAEDPRHQAAQQRYQQAVMAVERLIPPPLRGSQPLLPDALNQFRRCERESFR